MSKITHIINEAGHTVRRLQGDTLIHVKKDDHLELTIVEKDVETTRSNYLVDRIEHCITTHINGEFGRTDVITNIFVKSLK